MKYIVQQRWANHEPLTDEEIKSKDKWDRRPDPPEYEDKDKAIHRLEQDANRVMGIWPLRVITSEGEVLAVFDPELDTRMPGCRWRIIQRNAYHLWEAAGRPIGTGQEFWLQAEKELKEHNGITVLKA